MDTFVLASPSTSVCPPVFNNSRRELRYKLYISQNSIIKHVTGFNKLKCGSATDVSAAGLFVGQESRAEWG